LSPRVGAYIEILQQVNFELQGIMLSGSPIPGMVAVYMYHDDAQFAFGQICQLDTLDGDSLAGAPIEGSVD
jgi:hypothetical protein